MPPASPTLSVVVPCYNEAAVLTAMHDRVTRACLSAGVDFELVLVNDGSADRTWDGMLDLANRDPNLVCVNLSRNHGHQLALTAGLSTCRGALVLVIDADLQDPPEALPEMMALLDREGADVVYGQRASRPGETWFKTATAHVFYRLLDWLSDSRLPRDTGDFRLMTRRVVDQFLAMPERHRYVRGMISSIGFKQVPYRYERHPRAAGETHYTLKRMIRFAWDAITGFSTRPLTLPFRAAAGCGITAFLCWLASAVWWLAYRDVPTVGLLAGLLFILAGGQFTALGVMGEYLGRLYSEVRGRPLYIIDAVVRGESAAVPLPRRDVA